MADEIDTRQAKRIYDTLCSAFKDMDWEFEEDEGFVIESGAMGEDSHIRIRAEVDADRMLVILMSPIEFDVPENRRVDVALAVSAINNSLACGSFDYNFLSGEIIFRLTTSYRDSLISKSLFEYMILSSCKTVDEYNGLLLGVVEGDVTLRDLGEYING